MRARSHHRVSLRYPVRFCGDDIAGKGRLVDLSGPGCAVRSEVVPVIGTYLSLQIECQGGEDPIAIALARVRWVKGSTFGVEFLKYSRTAKERLSGIRRLRNHGGSAGPDIAWHG
ncbi:MAG: PilZ domain-containing protein [Nitrospiraceae bacterium]